MTDLGEWSAEFDEVLGRISSLFVDPSSRRHAEQYLRGLLSPIVRKNGWTIAEQVGEKEPKALHCVSRGTHPRPWRYGDARGQSDHVAVSRQVGFGRRSGG